MQVSRRERDFEDKRKRREDRLREFAQLLVPSGPPPRGRERGDTSLPDLDGGTDRMSLVDLEVCCPVAGALEGGGPDSSVKFLHNIAARRSALVLCDQLEDVSPYIGVALIHSIDEIVDRDGVAFSDSYSELRVSWFVHNLSVSPLRLVHDAIRNVDWKRYANVTSGAVGFEFEFDDKDDAEEIERARRHNAERNERREARLRRYADSIAPFMQEGRHRDETVRARFRGLATLPDLDDGTTGLGLVNLTIHPMAYGAMEGGGLFALHSDMHFVAKSENARFFAKTPRTSVPMSASR